MTPKEKAQELYDKYFFPHYVWENDGYQVDEKLTYEVRKRFALIAVDEIISSRKDDSQFDDTLWAGGSDMYTMHPMYLKYWQEVKQEIEKL